MVSHPLSERDYEKAHKSLDSIPLGSRDNEAFVLRGALGREDANCAFALCKRDSRSAISCSKFSVLFFVLMGAFLSKKDQSH